MRTVAEQLRPLAQKAFLPFAAILILAGSYFFPLLSEDPFETCTKERDRRVECLQEAIVQRFEERDLKSAFRLFIDLAARDHLLAAECHSIAHTLGRAAYQSSGGTPSFESMPELEYCNHGFYHGFLESTLWDGYPASRVRDLCDSLKGHSRNNEILYSCLIGFGHGVLDGNDPRLWGDPEMLAKPGVELCQAIAHSPAEKVQCFAGVFHALSTFYREPKYGISFDPGDPYELCRKQQDAVAKRTCYIARSMFNYNHLLLPSLLDFVPYLEKDLDAEGVGATVRILAYVKTVKEREKRSDAQSYVADDCYRLPEHLRVPCIRGIVLDAVLSYQGGYERAIRFCESPAVRDEEALGCFEDIYNNLPRELVRDYPVMEKRLLCLRFSTRRIAECFSHSSIQIAQSKTVVDLSQSLVQARANPTDASIPLAALVSFWVAFKPDLRDRDAG